MDGSPHLVVLVGRTAPNLADWFDPKRAWRVRVDESARQLRSTVRQDLPLAEVFVGAGDGDYDIVVVGAGAPEAASLLPPVTRWWSRLRRPW